jgi:IS5 family transposase
MRQPTLAEDFEKYHKKTRKEQFLEEIETIIPWKHLTGVIEPFYPNPQGAGHRPVGVDSILCIYSLKHWFNLSDSGAEEALYDSRAMRHFVDIDLSNEPVHDETTICKLRHLMERHKLGIASSTWSMSISSGERPEGGTRHHRRCHHHQCPEFHQESAQGQGLEHALHPQGQPMVLSHEGSYRRLAQGQTNPQRRGHHGERSRLSSWR